jgi:hypothetical protein
MAWTYGGDPAANSRDEVRFLLGDTDTNDQLVSDAEVAWAIAETDSLHGAAAQLADGLSAKYARYPDEKTGQQEEKSSQRAAGFAALAKRLRAAITTGANASLVFEVL